MGSEIVHDGHVSWWTGKIHARCGAVLEPSDYERVWLVPVTCPSCRRK